MRTLTGQEEAKQEKQELKAKAEKERWLPYLGELEEATYEKKVRHFKDPDGSVRTITDDVVKKEGTPRYSIVGRDLLEWRKGHGGTKRKLITTFKEKFQDTPDGRKARQQQSDFRAILRSNGIPGA